MAKEKLKLTSPIFRVGFPHLFEAHSFEEGGKKKYDLVAIFTPSTYTGKEKERWDAMTKALNDDCQRIFKKDWKDCKKSEEDGGIKNFKPGLQNGKFKKQEGFGEGTWYATLSSIYPPGVVDVKRQEISVKLGNDDEIYAGCYGRASVGVYAYDNIGKGAAIGLNSFQKVKDGERLDGRGDAGADFENEEIDSSWLDQAEGAVGDDDIPF